MKSRSYPSHAGMVIKVEPPAISDRNSGPEARIFPASKGRKFDFGPKPLHVSLNRVRFKDKTCSNSKRYSDLCALKKRTAL
ncbi:hypothetical protein NGR_c11800 [Sinorhizobium fredii NGR234]|uniref:Uncharacterized protein n=1 Tax=Sinorhizobium fredii (strain NBRC 101917 / NGR234) TaxID=394 RepID=C3MAW9_SINFN|nr:hypothetical protein NGR_c11800 [Sinorhizobium fredii NGR234]